MKTDPNENITPHPKAIDGIDFVVKERDCSSYPLVSTPSDENNFGKIFNQEYADLNFLDVMRDGNDMFILLPPYVSSENKKNQFALIATAWGHKGSLEHLSDMGAGLYTRYCLGDDYSKSAKDFKEMSELCEQLKNGLYSEKVATDIKRDESPNHFALSLELEMDQEQLTQKIEDCQNRLHDLHQLPKNELNEAAYFKILEEQETYIVQLTTGKIVLYPGRNESGEFYQSEDGKTYCVVKSGAIVHNDKLIANAKFDGTTHEKGINAGLTDTSYSVVVSYEKNWIGSKLIDASEQSLYDAVEAVNKMNGTATETKIC